MEGAALSVVAFTAKIASGLDNLYWASQRTGATVPGDSVDWLRGSQVGGGVDAARTALESLSRFVRNNPGAEGRNFLNRWAYEPGTSAGICAIWPPRASARSSAACRITGLTSMRRCWALMKTATYGDALGFGDSRPVQRDGKRSSVSMLTRRPKSSRFMTYSCEFGAMAGNGVSKIGSNLAGGLARVRWTRCAATSG